MKWLLFFVITVALFAVFTRSFYHQTNPDELKINDQVLKIEIADEETERIKGLSGRDTLAENSGLLFVFEKEAYYSIWMKEMNFPIDIAWLDKNKKIVHLESNVSPDTYPKTFVSKEPALYVLEVSAGFFTKNNIKAGDQAEF